jgi:UDP-N-acetylglucosamine--N-acetylmuramyl-(pentapeptide) pyrophosphoryl-undecaprenol N-acetylglucosamine transferase
VNDKRHVVVFAGGGTGGHLYPALRLAEALVEERPDVQPRFVGAAGGIEARVLPARGIPHLLVAVEGIRRDRRLANIPVLLGLVGAVVRVVSAYRRWRPRLVVATGGYAAAPAGLAAAVLRIPLALQEQNSLPGVTTKLLSRFASQIHLAFPEARDQLPASARAAVRVTGNPIRPVDRMPKAEARRKLGLRGSGLVVVITGGSQGSRALNDRLLDAVAGLVAGELPAPDGLELLWMTGPGNFDGVRQRLDGLHSPDWIHVVPYIEDMPAALAAADVAIGRAGAMSTAEFLASGLPALLVPLPTSAEGHQKKNALALQAAGVALCLVEDETTGAKLWEALVALAVDGARRRAMAQKALERARPHAAERIARDLAALLPPDPRLSGDLPP